MKELLFINLQRMVKECNHKKFHDYGFEVTDFSNEEFSAWFQIHEDANSVYCVEIKENGNTYLTIDGENICLIDVDDASNWKSLATVFFQDQYSHEIQNEKEKDSYNSWLDYQDTRGELQRHGW